ncbi:MFS transporter [Thermodesulfobacterium sp. TA1]|uniref:MFS transporter n=1 Tax=Thermodesulfobacterium sp. TA1 TaxID=2234087 RepID=UPI001231F2E4|nr:MFS transporter [Thermodesulfobacterium sp. TA1]QER42428.1 MFS transporter [Thermodesulfobacterium sp. TA1]
MELRFKSLFNFLDLSENPIRIKNFRYFILGHFISFTGSWAYNTAIIWLVYELTRSSFYLGIFSLFNSLPIFLFSLLAGLIIDRFNRRKLLTLVIFLGILPSFLLGFVAQEGRLTFWLVVAINMIAVSLSAVDTPLRQVFISEIVPTNYLTKAISFQALSFNTARMIGPLLAGLIISYGKLYQCFYLNALSYLPFLVFLLFFIKYEETYPREPIEGRGLIGEFKEVFFFFRQNPNIPAVLGTVFSFTFFGASIIILFPVIVDKIFGGGGKEFGHLSSMVGIGAILGSFYVILGKVKDKLNKLWVSTCVFALGALGVVWSKVWWLTLFCCLMLGFAFTNFYPIANSYIQENTPSEIRGRVVSFFTFSFLGVHPLGSFLAGILTEKIGLGWLVCSYMVFLVLGNFLLINIAKLRK